jgi:integrase
MGVYLPKGPGGRPKSPFWHYDFKLRPTGSGKSERFFGSTGQKTKKAAERYEAKTRELAALGRLSCTMTVAQACDRYWDEVLIRAASADDQATNLELLCEFYGADTLLVAIDPDAVAKAAARRSRAHLRRFNRRTGHIERTKILPKPATVNRQVVEPMRRILRRAKKVWKLPIDLEQFEWGLLSHAEPAERARELSVEEEDRFWGAVRDDYGPICELYIISGRRRSDWVKLPKFKVDRTAGTVRFPARKRKEKGEIVVELTARELEIVRSEWEKAADCEYVFTYEVQHGKHKGERRPITEAGLRRATDNAFRKAKLDDFRRHDFRHTFASRFGRAAGGDLRKLQVAMDHEDISSTVRYRHVHRSEVTEGRAAVTVSRNSPGNNVIPMLKKRDTG